MGFGGLGTAFQRFTPWDAMGRLPATGPEMPQQG